MNGKVTASKALEKLVYSVRPNKIADVWLRKNIEEVEMDPDKKGDIQKQYIADEVYFIIDSNKASADEINDNFDYWYRCGAGLNADTLADRYSMAVLRKTKLQEISNDCESVIYKGVNVTLSDGIHHFSLTEKDQLNLFGLQTKIAAGETKIEYHSDGEPCKYFSASNIKAMVSKAMFHVSYHTTYCNSLNMWIKGMTKQSEMERIVYGADIPEKYQSEVLKNYLSFIGGAANG